MKTSQFLQSPIQCLIASSFVVGSVAFGIGCSTYQRSHSHFTTEQKALLEKPLSLDLFAARGFLGGSDYERYHLENGELIRECGTVLPKKSAQNARARLEGDKVLGDDPNLQVQNRRFEQLSDAQILEIKEKALQLLSATNSTASGSKLPPPGSVFTLAGSGLFELKVQLGETKKNSVTSVDAVSEAKSPTLASSQEIFETLRGIGPEPCGSSTFFGVGRKPSPVK